MVERSKFVVSAQWLEQRLGQSDLKIVDASWYLPMQNRNAQEEYRNRHIPGAVFFDQDLVVDTASDLPHTIPSPEAFGALVSDLGLSNSDTIIVYDGPGMFTAPRVWWMLRTMGAPNVFVLDGGFDRWKEAGLPVTDDIPQTVRGTFQAVFNRQAVATLADMRSTVDTGSMQIADARSAGRFSGADAEPREGMRSGHMPGARNVPVFSLSSDGQLLALDALRNVITQAGIDLSKPVVTTCGSGVTAAVITLALESLGHQELQLYDGSWSEWGSRDDTPVATGEA
ncbi:MAG: 3-mercaptopyruvate sulfurtransferase [Rhizobiaceae bacterium]|nr:3-mercaptopyruvate sulfurtransferase [Rhizobiaceae bacterium]